MVCLTTKISPSGWVASQIVSSGKIHVVSCLGDFHSLISKGRFPQGLSFTLVISSGLVSSGLICHSQFLQVLILQV